MVSKRYLTLCRCTTGKDILSFREARTPTRGRSLHKQSRNVKRRMAGGGPYHQYQISGRLQATAFPASDMLESGSTRLSNKCRRGLPLFFLQSVPSCYLKKDA